MHAASRSDDVSGQPIPRSRVAIGLDPALRGRLAALAAGRAVRIDWFATRCCSTAWIGDLTARWMAPADAAAPGLVELAPIEGVPIRAAAGLLELLADAGPSLRLGGPLFARHLALDLRDAAAWLDFMETPVAHRRH